MYRMSGQCRPRGVIPALLVILLPAFGCTRRAPNLPTESAVQSNPNGFQGEGTAESPGRGSSPDEAPVVGLPFQNSEVVASGSLLTVRLKLPLVAGTASKSFKAVLDEPVTVNGIILIPRDAIVSGEIESANVSKTRPDRGYVRLTLNSVEIDAESVPIQTASLFVRQTSAASENSAVIRLERGRRLTFRLKEQLFLHPRASKSGQ
jgi:hypothetical protein